jgi:hypothetical protein
VRARFTDPHPLGAVDLRSDFIPLFVTGRIVGEPGSRTRDIAIAVDGRIVSMSRSVHLAGDHAQYFAGLVPERAVRQGANTVQVLSVTETASGRLVLGSLARSG